MIGSLYSAASETNDLRTMDFLGWFIREQSEEEKNADAMIQKYLMYGLCSSCCDCTSPGADFGLCGGGLYALSQEFADRIYTVTEYPFS